MLLEFATSLSHSDLLSKAKCPVRVDLHKKTSVYYHQDYGLCYMCGGAPEKYKTLEDKEGNAHFICLGCVLTVVKKMDPNLVEAESLTK